MAEINTGLGWAANGTYLISADDFQLAQLPAHIGGANFPGQPLPVATTRLDVIANGFLLFERDEGVNYVHHKYYIAADRAGAVLVADWGSSPPGTMAFRCVTNQNGAKYYVADDANPNYFETVTMDRSQGSGYYSTRYGQSSSTGINLVVNPLVPRYADINTFIAAIQTVPAETFTKVNQGYAVACVAKWKTTAGVTITTPVLISSVSEYTDMSTSGSYNLAKLNVLRDGMRFYMSFFDTTGMTLSSSLPTVDLAGPDDPARSLETVFAYIADLQHAAILVLNSPDPYNEEGAGAGEEGGDGEELEDDPVEEETLPLPSVAGHGFCTIYVPSSQELNQMASYLWGGSFDVSQVIKLFSNPMDSILGLSAVPVDLVGTQEQIYLGGVALTGITMPKYTGRTSVKVDFGTVTVSERWGSYLDYAPYTEFSVYLPFIGIKPIKADDIMGKTVSLMYAIDILSGGCVAYLRPAGGSVLYEWSGQCALQIPVTGRSYDNVFQSAMSVATAAFAAVAAPASAPVLSGAVASAAVQAAASKPHIERSGTVNGITGFLGQLRPYLIRTIPEAFIPTDQNKFIGYPAYINVDLASVTGYNEVDSIHLENVTATGAELDEIETILKGGVIF